MRSRQHWTDKHGIALSLAVWGLLLLILSSVYASARYPSCSKDEDCEAVETCVTSAGGMARETYVRA